MEIMPVAMADLPLFKALTPTGWDDITDHFSYSILSLLCDPVKAMIDGAIAGCGNIMYHEDTAWLASIIVQPQYRGQGIGIAITQALLGRIDRIRYPAVMLDATEFGYPVYRKAGFEVVAEHAHFTGATLPAKEVPSAHIVAFEERYRNDVYDIDKEATGEGRSSILSEHISNAMLYVADGTVLGAYFPDLVKGLVIAKEPRAGIALMKQRLFSRDACMLPAQNKAAIEFLHSIGYIQVRTSTRMCIGKAPEWNPDYIYNTISGARG